MMDFSGTALIHESPSDTDPINNRQQQQHVTQHCLMLRCASLSWHCLRCRGDVATDLKDFLWVPVTSHRWQVAQFVSGNVLSHPLNALCISGHWQLD